MDSCSDCIAVKKQIEKNPDYEIIDIGSSAKLLKEFLRLRDNSPVFENVRAKGSIGIPCFVMENGTVTLSPEDVGLSSKSDMKGNSCSLDGKGC